MPLESISFKQRTINRAKALAALLLPLLAAAIVFYGSSTVMRTRATPERGNESTQTRADHEGWLFADTASSADATVKQETISTTGAGATTVTVYTIIPKY